MFLIRILDTITGFPDEYLQNGAIYLSVPNAPILARALGSINNITDIGIEAALDITIPFNAKDDITLERFRRVHRGGNDYLNIQCTLDGAYVPYDRLTADTNFSTRSYSIKLELSRNHWVRKLEETTLNNVTSLGEYEFKPTLVTSTWTSIPHNSGLYFPLANYGNFSNNIVVLSDFRPWLQAFWVLDKMFCHFGYNFKCPYLESSFGSELYCYILSENLGASEYATEQRKFMVKVSNVDNQFTEVVTNPGGFYNPTTRRYTGNGVFDFHATLEGLNPFGTAGDSIYLTIYNSSTGETIEDSKLGTGQFKLNIDLVNVVIRSGEYLEINVDASPNMSVLSSSFYNIVKNVIPDNGDIINIASILRKDYCIDFFKGFVHLLAGKVEYEPSTKTITLFTQRDTTIQGDNIEGFYKNTVNALSSVQLIDTESLVTERLDNERYLKIGFKKTNDPNYKNKSEEETLFTRIIDRGSEFKEDTKTALNPYFEPTVQIDTFDVHPDRKTPIYLPALHDNDEGELSLNIGPRIGVAIYTGQARLGQLDSPGFLFNGNTYTNIPIVIQDKPDDVTLTGYVDKRLIYGEKFNDLYNVAWKFEAALRSRRKIITLKIKQYYHQFKQLSFRNFHNIFLDGKYIDCRLEDMAFDDNTKSSDLTLLPEKNFLPDCEQLGAGQKEKCLSAPAITINYDSDNNLVDAIADDTRVVESIIEDTWEYSTDNGVTWLSYTPSDPIAASTTVHFRRTVKTESCGKQTVVKNYSPTYYCNNQADIILDYDLSKNTITANGEETLNSTIDAEGWEYSIDEGNYVDYIEGTAVSGFTTIVFRRTLSFTDACPSILIEKGYNAAIQAICNNEPVLQMSEIADCLVIPEITGSYASDIATVIYEVAEDGVNYKKWDNKPIRHTDNLKVKASILYCDACPKICLLYECES